VNFGTLTPQTGSNFDNQSLSGNYLGGTHGPASWSVDTEVDFLSADGDGNITLTYYDNYGDGGGPQPPQTNPGTYAVSSTGRVVSPATGAPQQILYIISPTEIIGMDAKTTDNNPRLTDYHQ
jgi:hypothetical protein